MPHETTGTLVDASTVTLDLPMPNGQANGRVRVLVERIEPKQTRPILEVLAEIHEDQRARGHIPMTAEEVDAYIQGERDSWND